MRLDQHGLPVQADGNANDQLNRVGFVATGIELSGGGGFGKLLQLVHFDHALKGRLQPKPGVYTRYVGGDPANVSADQLVPVLAYWIASRNVKQAARMFWAMIKRAGFAQNVKDGLDGTERRKLPDFMALRTLPLFSRATWYLYPAVLLCDLLLVIAALASCGPVWKDDKGFSKRSPDDVDDGALIATLAVSRARLPTPLSWLACKLYGKLRPWNYGCEERLEAGKLYVYDRNEFHPVYGSLRWYHRAENGGNPEIAELWRPICQRYFER